MLDWKTLFDPGRGGTARDLGLLVLRVGVAAPMTLTHGWQKVQGFGQHAAGFPDPLGLGPSLSMALATCAEFACALALLVGFMGRLSAVPPAITMAVAFFIVHSGDPFGKKELALLYLAGFLALAITGPGRLSIDGLIHAGRGRRR